jgi:hypothetical protein
MTRSQTLERTSTMTLSSSDASGTEATITVAGLPLSRVAETPTGHVGLHDNSGE